MAAKCTICGRGLSFTRRLVGGGLCSSCATERVVCAQEARDEAQRLYSQALADLESDAPDPTRVTAILSQQAALTGFFEGFEMRNQTLTKIIVRRGRQERFQLVDHFLRLLDPCQRVGQRGVFSNHFLEQFTFIGAADMRIVGRSIDRALSLPKRTGQAKPSLPGIGPKYLHAERLG